MKKISFFPKKQVTLASALSTQDTYLTIKEETYIGKPSLFFPFLFNTDEKIFKGLVEKESFTVIKLPRSIHSNFIVDYLVSGKIESGDNGSIITLDISLQKYRKRSYSAFFAIGFLILLFFLVTAIFQKFLPLGIIFIFIFLLVLNIIERLIFNIVSTHLIKIFKGLLIK